MGTHVYNSHSPVRMRGSRHIEVHKVTGNCVSWMLLNVRAIQSLQRILLSGRSYCKVTMDGGEKHLLGNSFESVVACIERENENQEGL